MTVVAGRPAVVTGGTYLTDAEAGTTYARIRAAVGGNRTVFIGDSIMVSSDSVAGQRGISIPTYGSITSYQRLNYVRNAGVAGNTTAQMLARFNADVIQHDPSVVVILGGTNDSNDSNAVSLDTFADNIEAMVAECREAAALPILCTVPPNDTGTARKLRIASYNAWLRDYCSSEGIALVDFYALLVDPETGDYHADYLNDGTHPNNPGYAAMGRMLGQVALDVAAPTEVWLPTDNEDPLNLISGGLFLTNTGSGATFAPTDWTVVSTQHRTGITADFVTGDAAIAGSWYRLVSTTHTGTDTTYQEISTGIVPGHRYALVGRVKATSLTGGATVTARALWNGVTNTPGYDVRAMSTLGYDLADGIFHVVYEAPSDAEDVQINMQFNAGAGTYQVAQLGFYDVTALGLTA